jgi:ATP-dependent DNA ligase
VEHGAKAGCLYKPPPGRAELDRRKAPIISHGEPEPDSNGRCCAAQGVARRANDPGCCIHFSDHVIGSGQALFEAAEAAGLEGIVSKRVGSRYRSGPTKSWLKVKCFGEGEFVVIGTAKGERAPVALLARHTGEGLEYAGAAMVTLADPEREAFWRLSEELKTERPALPMGARKETTWLRPEMRVRARLLRGEEMLRHATVRSIAAGVRVSQSA